MSLLTAIEEAEVTPELVLVDYKGRPSLARKGEFEPDIRTIAYRIPGEASRNPGDAGPVHEFNLYPGLNAIPQDIWEFIKPSIGYLLKPGRKLAVSPISEIEIVNGTEALHREEWVKEKALITECGKFSTLTEDRAADLVSRCVDEGLLDKFATKFSKSPIVKEAIAVQRQMLASAVN